MQEKKEGHRKFTFADVHIHVLNYVFLLPDDAP